MPLLFVSTSLAKPKLVYCYCGTSSLVLEAVTGTPAAAFLDFMSLSRSLSSGSGINSELIARLVCWGAGNGAGAPSQGGRYTRGIGVVWHQDWPEAGENAAGSGESMAAITIHANIFQWQSSPVSRKHPNRLVLQRSMSPQKTYKERVCMYLRAPTPCFLRGTAVIFTSVLNCCPEKFFHGNLLAVRL